MTRATREEPDTEQSMEMLDRFEDFCIDEGLTEKQTVDVSYVLRAWQAAWTAAVQATLAAVPDALGVTVPAADDM